MLCILFEHADKYSLIVFGDLFVDRETSSDRDLLCIYCSADHHCCANYSSLQKTVSPFYVNLHIISHQSNSYNSKAR